MIKASWGTAADAQINIVPQSRFFNQWNTVTGVDPNTGRIDIADSERHRLIDKGSWFWIEGVQAELDEPDEWFLNPTTGRLFYMPPAGVDPNTQDIIAPFLNRIVNVKGDVNAGTHVEHVHFDGLEFRHTTFTLGHIEARVHTDTAIMFENTSDSSVKNCRFENIGGYALWLHLDSQRNVFDRNTVRYSGGGGVLLTGARLAYMDDSKIYTPGEAAAKVAPILNRITRNTVEHCGKIRYYGGGVHLDSRPFGMTMAPGNYIAHNHFNDLSRNGVFAFRNQGGNVMEYNHIHNAMQTTIDGGCVHFATMNTLNAPNHILNNWLYDAWGYHHNPSGTPNRKLANGDIPGLGHQQHHRQGQLDLQHRGRSGEGDLRRQPECRQSGNQSSEHGHHAALCERSRPGRHGDPWHRPWRPTSSPAASSPTPTPPISPKPEPGKRRRPPASSTSLSSSSSPAPPRCPRRRVYTLPITEDGNYQISLLYKPGADRASNVPSSSTMPTASPRSLGT